jgi:hypothetical protein
MLGNGAVGSDGSPAAAGALTGFSDNKAGPATDDCFRKSRREVGILLECFSYLLTYSACIAQDSANAETSILHTLLLYQ